MEKEVQKLFTTKLLEYAINKWGGSPDNLKLIGELENFVYEFNDGQNNFILRITHSSHRSNELIKAELDWINFLAVNDIPVCKPIPSINNSFIETFESENSYFIICAFEKARGQLIKRDDFI